MEGSDPNRDKIRDSKHGLGLGQWMKGQLSRTPLVASNAFKRSDLRLLLGVLGAPLSPVQVGTNDPLPHLCIKDTPIEQSKANIANRERMYTKHRCGSRSIPVRVEKLAREKKMLPDLAELYKETHYNEKTHE